MGNPLSELGLSADGDRIAASVDHALLLQASPSIQEPLVRAMSSFAESSRDASKALKVLAVAGAAYLVMSGVAKIVEASKSKKAERGCDCRCCCCNNARSASTGAGANGSSNN
mmetsp:Transcript_12006/g.20028  ORF Transcript_12006/g.20028 Transcript_12006/m.20028 type:complete len:113 (-) Transcript_12006:184-522(-)